MPRYLFVIASLVLPLALNACGGDGGTLESAGGTPPPAAGPARPSSDGGADGSAIGGSPAFRYYVTKVHAALGGCVSCHAAGTNGATLMLATDPEVSYKTLEGQGLVVLPSPLITKGPHAGGTAGALDPTSQEPYVRRWLEMEAEERVGQASPESVYTKLAKCMQKDLFARINLCMATTKPRIGENGNNCTGCKYEACANCHAAGGQNTGFWCSATRQNTTDVDDTFENSKKLPFIRRYFGLSGTEAVASNAIRNKSTATANATSTAAHPWYELDAAKQKALDVFVADALDRYARGDCETAAP
jgi:cytochrome c553